jgi:hypothetical protein
MQGSTQVKTQISPSRMPSAEAMPRATSSFRIWADARYQTGRPDFSAKASDAAISRSVMACLDISGCS